jgi:DNA mismatch repair protein MutS
MISGNFGEDYHSFIWKIGFTKKITHLKQQALSNNFFERFWNRRIERRNHCFGSHFILFVETQHNKVQHITAIQRIAEDYAWMDRLIRNLELYQL